MTSRAIFIFLIGLLLTACSSSPEKQDTAETVSSASDDAMNSATTATDGTSARTFGAGADSRSGLSALDDPASPLSIRVLYFDYDSSEILPAYREALESHANYVANNPGVTISLEGHADERGSREYNLALGERRAQSTKRLMMVFGPATSQIRTTSYGEERAIANGHDETSWSQNRRVEIIY